MENIILLYRRFKRAVKFFKTLKYGGSSWWVYIPSKDEYYQGEHSILWDWGTLNKKGFDFKLQKAKVSWYLAGQYVLNNDGLYSILEEKKNKLSLYKVSYL